MNRIKQKYLYVGKRDRRVVGSEVEFGYDYENSTTCVKESRKIYTFHFHKSTNPGDLKVFFNKFGKVQEVCIRKCKIRYEKHNRFAFVIFEEIDGARKAVAANPSELELNGCFLKVRYAESVTKIKKLPTCKSFGQMEKSEIRKLTSVKGSRIAEDSCVLGKRNLGINDLNDDCLFQIFSYFTMREKIRLESVCKRWHGVLLEQWKMTTYLNFEKEHRFKRLNVDILQGLLKKCGPSILKVNLPQFHFLRRSTVHMIADYCVNLRHLSIHNLSLSAKDVHGLISNCKYLKSLELKRPLLKKNQNFQIVQEALDKIPLESFVFMHKIDDCKFLSSLPSTLKHLELISCDKLVETHLLSGLSKVTNLQSFRIDNILDTLVFNEELYSKISNVEEFGATAIRRTGLVKRPLHLKHLHNLRKLSFRCSNLVLDSVLAKISEECKKLEVLDISGCGIHKDANKVSDLGIKALVKHSVLTDLSISHCPGFTDYGLSILANAGKLKKLSCGFCQNITDVGCSQLISLCLELELFNIEGCGKISAVVVASAMSTVSMRSEKKTLHLFVKGTPIRPSEIPKSNISLEVHREQYRKDCVVPTPKIRPVRRLYRPYRRSHYYNEWSVNLFFSGHNCGSSNILQKK